MALTLIDYMEYSSDANAQVAYVTDSVGEYLNTGGNITTDGLYTVHIFTSSGTFVCGKDGTVEVLVVAGGGGGGGCQNVSNRGAGGGGAGGVINNTSFNIVSGNITVTVGNGGSGGSAGAEGGDGGNSIFSTITAYGGGGGAKSITGATNIGRNGGSGGGGTAVNGSGGNGTSGQGNTGGSGGDGSSGYAGGGGAGAGAVGGSGGNGAYGGNGGSGSAYTISGTSTYYGGGGGAGGSSGYASGAGSGGNGGGGAGGFGANGSGGVTNRGGGGGGGGGPSKVGGAGGSGIVIIRCLTTNFLSVSVLQSYSEATIKTQGSYALKIVAAITDSLNKTLTRTIASPIDLSGKKYIKFQVRAVRTGSNFKIGFHDAGGTTTEVTPNIIEADKFQEVYVDISGVSDANKDAIDEIKITILNADAANIIYFDNMYGIIPRKRIIY